ncbi:MAG: hypothetical protein V3R35_05405 [Woeseiaceae bacterium]|jgi:hypothetical protein
MAENEERHVPWFLWPFYAVWRLLTFILNITGRIISAFIGLALMAAGISITLSIVGAPLGIPMAVFGFLLLVRALF